MTFPNQLSVLRMLLSPLFLFLFLSQDDSMKKLSVLIYFIATLTDWYDGWHARKFGVITRTGIFLDPLADKILTSAAFLGFYKVGIMPFWMIAIIIIRDIVITLLRSVNEAKGITIKTSWIAKIKTFIQMTFIFLILVLYISRFFNISYGLKDDIVLYLNSGLNYWLMLLVTIITLYSGISYFFERKIEMLDKNNKTVK
ncbi:CDP-diacylglycerol--glycerol-3-phosphate 3-phosphatidyltransferase [soil metagenome]